MAIAAVLLQGALQALTYQVGVTLPLHQLHSLSLGVARLAWGSMANSLRQYSALRLKGAERIHLPPAPSCMPPAQKSWPVATQRRSMCGPEQ